ncbi:MAG: tRNA (adenosine(37)-N6)-threonylcarbamoyltransferase complex dimerization subunit type 1 TsaB [Spirochaetes bacterium GWF1_41_5]|nr:MAG: tRNA (adenosine(37)-N6)-threonylcarbamoyltransferase complex dimerization subunit type 1 TsaB [Spirochaetes bacterium GWF1_41_5]HBE03593.1 tRNA (adenosine(37)-N6)-threonylcarbamoyltransferase complex dimerization subunit type 1 TsaB [Spirochaetia bacterium]
MIILASDTSTISLSVCLLKDDAVFEFYAADFYRHNETLLPAAEELCRKAGCSIKEINALAVAAGPGSFTGLRIGIMTFKSLAYALDVPLYSCNSLDLLAQNARHVCGLVMPVIDAKKKSVYTALYRQGSLISSYLDLPACELKKFCTGYTDEKIFILGYAADSYPEEFREIPNTVIMEKPFWNIRSYNIALSALADISAGKPAADPFNLKPYYLRRSEAEINFRIEV